ncbi:MFS transporter [Microbacterium horticulturae]|uniref:MFS transporter n=1 Tax=Microbacterium horticulturae TaxID=3028316 RepID=A0ABY8BXA1_9MICO|nr:MFS transporter [Microbacterium sp. KACC 23027]WEG08789.1 MFS transporter [Microbacterium sp. KACC 23027]
MSERAGHSGKGWPERWRAHAKAAVSSLAVRNYRLYFIGQSISVIGTFMQTLALAFLVLQLGGQGTEVGLVAAARLVPFIILGPWGGLVVDRANRRAILLVTQIVSGIGALVFATLAWTQLATVPILGILSLLLGVVNVFDNPARQSLIADLVDRQTLNNAVVLSSVSINIARLVGGVIGGALVAAVGAPLCFLINAASFAAVIVSLLMLNTSDMQPIARVERARGQIRTGLAYVATTPELLLPLIMLMVTGTLAYEFPTTLPLFATDAFGGTAATYGLMAAAEAAGGIVGGFVAARRTIAPRTSSLAISAIGWGAAILLTAVAPTLLLALVLLLFVGYGTITFNSTAKSVLQLSARPDMRGRVMSLWGMAWIGSTVVGAPLVGWIAENFGSRWGLIAGGVPTILTGALLLPYLRRQERGRRVLPDNPGDQ